MSGVDENCQARRGGRAPAADREKLCCPRIKSVVAILPNSNIVIAMSGRPTTPLPRSSTRRTLIRRRVRAAITARASHAANAIADEACGADAAYVRCQPTPVILRSSGGLVALTRDRIHRRQPMLPTMKNDAAAAHSLRCGGKSSSG